MIGDTLDTDLIYRIWKGGGGVGWCTVAGNNKFLSFSPRGEAMYDGRW